MYIQQKVGLSLMAAGISSNVSAGVLELDTHLDAYLSAGDLISGSFDINPFLEEQRNNGFEINPTHAVVTMYGFSSETATPTTYQYQDTTVSHTRYAYSGYSYSCGWSTCYSYYTYSYSIYQSHVDAFMGDGETDVLLVDFGDQIITDSTANVDSYISYQSNYNYYSNYTSYTYYDRNEYGEVSGSAALSSFSFADLTSDGILNWDLAVQSGHFNLVDLNFSMTYDEVAVPAPGTLGLFGLSLISLLGVNTRRRKKLITEAVETAEREG